MNKILFHLLFKDLLEARRSYKLLIMIITFFFLGLTSPIFAYYMPELFKLIGSQQGLIIDFNTPTVTDSLLEYYKNISQVSLFVMIFIFMGAINIEKEKGTAAFLLVKPVKSYQFILSKYISMTLLLFISIIISTTICGIYTYSLFKTLNIVHLVKISFFLFIYLLTILSITLLFSSLFSKQIVSGICAFVTWIMLETLSSIKIIGLFLPGRLSSEAQATAFGMSTEITPVFGSIVLIIISILLSIHLIKKRI